MMTDAERLKRYAVLRAAADIIPLDYRLMAVETERRLMTADEVLACYDRSSYPADQETAARIRARLAQDGEA